MSVQDDIRDVRAGLSFHVGRALPCEFAGLVDEFGLRAGSWVFPVLSADPLPCRETPVERLAKLGKFLRERAEMASIGMLVPGDPGWPAGTGCDDLPCLWVQGDTDVAAAVTEAVAVTGSRACTSYGGHVAASLATDMAGAGWTVVTTASLGVSRHAIGGVLAVAQAKPVLLAACGLDQCGGHHRGPIVQHAASRGTVISVFPPGCELTRSRAQVTDHLLYRMALGSVLVEASLRGGAVQAARQAAEAGCRVWAVPGPITSAMSAGCHQLLRAGAAQVATAADEVMAALRDTSDRPLLAFTIHATVRWDDGGLLVAQLAPFQVWAGTPAHAANEGLDVVLAAHRGRARVDLVVQAPSGSREEISIEVAGPVTAESC
ncbi:DNA-processing protein DprA [Paractinoplanes rishiriensis]|uniref:Smf/DprA SLOG domain-containing protein n=1 Tax=Paractinoplanes rishiriensis TaxID=1050105 RepID=A0A919KCH9_9ACTN|nr:DNA-processing protein DprA [Actinoplanes rishiriensis]GIF01097.1 hypothetical protein Ari01nite_85610 [Actinoplanes rishiriensis]